MAPEGWRLLDLGEDRIRGREGFFDFKRQGSHLRMREVHGAEKPSHGVVLLDLPEEAWVIQFRRCESTGDRRARFVLPAAEQWQQERKPEE